MLARNINLESKLYEVQVAAKAGQGFIIWADSLQRPPVEIDAL